MGQDNLRLRVFEGIAVNPDRNMILTRLGYKKTSTVLSNEYVEKLNQNIKQGLLLCNPKGIFGRFKILSWCDKHVEFDNGIILHSKDLAKFLEGCHEVILMAATVGSDITDIIHQEVAGGDAAFGLILDAVASETADAALDWMVDFINKMIRREGIKLTKNRYSPGYGDLLLQNQKTLFDILQLDRLGLGITESCILVPEKSVIAIAGITSI